MGRAYLGLGANLGDRLGTLRQALAELARQGDIVACSSVYETEPWGYVDQPMFLNLCCALDTALPPDALHAALKAAERRLGRTPGALWGPRRIDIDLLTYEEARIATQALTVPHPRIAERPFVLAPLAEIAPDLRIAGLDRTVAELLAGLPDAARQARPVAPAVAVLR
ncbi:MAG: 2-amino-4-hydroxy-6-hydroxymethyldihydropteridine diphosphokinase [Chloroflexi bacterium]|nr:2-amino-4-hydroxy-6-hydroxymethyldihydropteridine diphosphokinase [Chloroflexota bacterium]